MQACSAQGVPEGLFSSQCAGRPAGQRGPAGVNGDLRCPAWRRPEFGRYLQMRCGAFLPVGWGTGHQTRDVAPLAFPSEALADLVSWFFCAVSDFGRLVAHAFFGAWHRATDAAALPPNRLARLASSRGIAPPPPPDLSGCPAPGTGLNYLEYGCAWMSCPTLYTITGEIHSLHLLMGRCRFARCLAHAPFGALAGPLGYPQAAQRPAPQRAERPPPPGEALGLSCPGRSGSPRGGGLGTALWCMIWPFRVAAGRPRVPPPQCVPVPPPFPGQCPGWTHWGGGGWLPQPFGA
jgi:hypothetical protein